MKQLHLYLAPLVLTSITLGGCNRYAFSLNDNELYRPAPLYSDFRLTDQALETCIRQTISDKQITKVEQLTALRCSNAGIRSLAGLDHFAWLQKLDLSENNVRDGAPLSNLKKLRYLKISGNPELDCAELAKLEKTVDPEIIAPSRCDSST